MSIVPNEDEEPAFEVGDRVYHREHGHGTIESARGPRLGRIGPGQKGGGVMEGKGPVWRLVEGLLLLVMLCGALSAMVMAVLITAGAQGCHCACEEPAQRKAGD